MGDTVHCEASPRQHAARDRAGAYHRTLPPWSLADDGGNLLADFADRGGNEPTPSVLTYAAQPTLSEPVAAAVMRDGTQPRPRSLPLLRFLCFIGRRPGLARKGWALPAGYPLHQ
jgi:hypothetical protein